MLRRLFILIKSWFGIEPDKFENPGILLDQAKREMDFIHARNWERAEQAEASRDNLASMAEDSKKRIDDLEAEIEEAQLNNNIEVEQQLSQEKRKWQALWEGTKADLIKATEGAEAIRKYVEWEREEIQKKIAETLILKSQWEAARNASTFPQSPPGGGESGVRDERSASGE
jgi:phage shock protein A